MNSRHSNTNCYNYSYFSSRFPFKYEEDAKKPAEKDVEKVPSVSCYKLLNMFDKLDRAQSFLENIPVENFDSDVKDFILSQKEGNHLLLNFFLTTLEEHNVRLMNLAGKTFDPGLASAVSIESSASMPEGTVLREEVKGFLYNDKKLREAKVVVARTTKGIGGTK